VFLGEGGVEIEKRADFLRTRNVGRGPAAEDEEVAGRRGRRTDEGGQIGDDPEFFARPDVVSPEFPDPPTTSSLPSA
jgi:hypothetical protein